MPQEKKRASHAVDLPQAQTQGTTKPPPKNAAQNSSAYASAPKTILSEPILQVKNVCKRFSKKEVLTDVSFAVEEGDIFGIVGMSGSGKTTLFQMLIGFDRPDSGEILAQKSLLTRKHGDGSIGEGTISVFKVPSLVQKRFGLASQMPSFYDHLTIEENLRFYGTLYGMPPKVLDENKERLLQLTGLAQERDTLASKLSGGMQRRLDIACALIHHPRVLLLDEPTSDLDPIIRRQIWNLIKEVNQQGTTVIVSSHILEEVERLCTKIAILHDRKILGYGTLDELKCLFSKKQEVHIRSTPGDYENIIVRLRKEQVSIERYIQKDGALIIFTPKEEPILHKVVLAIEKAKENVISLDVNETTLSEIFEMLTQKRSLQERQEGLS